MHNVEKWPNILKDFAAFSPQDFKKMHGHFSALCKNVLNILKILEILLKTSVGKFTWTLLTAILEKSGKN